MSSYKEPIGRRMSRKQSDLEAPEMKMVSVAVLPPRLPPGLAPPTGIAMSGAVGFDERINWDHNIPASTREIGKVHQFTKKIGLTKDRKKANPDLPPFTFRQVPYDTWRKHYAKDADGNYRGTHAPAQDCLLKPEDVQKWRFEEEPKTHADKWTRGQEVLPVYSEIEGQGRVPEYEFEYFGVPPGEPTVDANAATAPPLETPHKPSTDMRTGKVIADGKTAQDIIEEAKAKQKPTAKQTWKQMLKKGGEMAMLGN
eukprot:c30424_g1_i1 orf=1-765(+)